MNEPYRFVDLVCPCCAERVTVDMAATEHECGRCSQEWTMEVDQRRIVNYSAL